MFAWAAAAALLLDASARAAEPLCLAALEQPQCRQPLVRSIRPLFVASGGQWLPLDAGSSSQCRPAEGIWRIGLDGRVVGAVEAADSTWTDPDEWTFRRDHGLEIQPGASLPRGANRGDRFEGWCGPPRYRPLVASTRAQVSDPDSWKPRPFDLALRSRHFATFRGHIGAAERCSSPEAPPVAFAYRGTDLKVSRSYRDRAGRWLFALRLDADKNECDGPPAVAWSTHWFLLAGDSVRYLGPDFDLVDAGDYDGDGQSDLLFWYGGYNEDGYTLLYDGLRRRADFHWNYH